MKNRALQPITQIASLGKALSLNRPVHTSRWSPRCPYAEVRWELESTTCADQILLACRI